MATVNPFQKLLDQAAAAKKAAAEKAAAEKTAADKAAAEKAAQAAAISSPTTQNQSLSGADLLSFMQKNNISPAQMASSSGLSEGVIVSRIAQALDYGKTANLGGTIIQPVYEQSSLQGIDAPLTTPLQEILVYKEGQKTGDSYKQYSPTGDYIKAGAFKDAGNFGDLLQDMTKAVGPVAAMALSAGGAGSLLGGLVAPTATAATQAALGGALLSGGMTAAQGGNAGDILTSAIKGGIPAAIAPVTSAVSEAVGSQALGNALVSGALSKTQGGDFLQGAIMGGLSGAAKDATMNQANQYLNTVEPGIPYDASTSPTELDVIQAFPELAPPPENLTQGVTDILNYAANAPAVQVAAAPTYVGELSGVPYDPNYVSDSGTGAYRLEIGGTGDQQGTEPSLVTVPTQEQAQLQIDDLIAQLEPYLAQTPTLEDIQSIIGQQNFATPEDVQTAISRLPSVPNQQDIINIIDSRGLATSQGLSNLANELGLTQQELFNQLGGIEQGFGQQISNLESGLNQQFQTGLQNLADQFGLTQQELFNQLGAVEQGFGERVANVESQLTQQGRDLMSAFERQGIDYKTALDEAIKTQGQKFETSVNDLTSQIGNIETNLESRLNQQGRDFMDYLQQQGFDYETSLNEALFAQENKFGTALNQNTEDLLNEIAASGAGLQREFQTGLQGLANQLGITQQEFFNQIGGVQTNLESQLNQQGRDFMDYLRQQGFDYETSLNEALVAQQNQFGTALDQNTEDLLGEIAASGAGLQQEFQTGLQGLANQLGITQQELIDQLNQAQESFGTQVSGLQEQFTNLGTTNAQQFNDLMKTVGLLGTGLGALQSTFKSAQEAALPKQFAIVAPPSEWKSPTYNLPSAGQVPFTPSAPIDFGSPELLQGTQFARPQVQATQMPYDLSNVINTLNFESVPFVQQPVAQSFTGFASQPTAGVNNIIGNLNGTPVSIADIISNIQGQYGQKTAS